jgi:hypothetical protein
MHPPTKSAAFGATRGHDRSPGRETKEFADETAERDASRTEEPFTAGLSGFPARWATSA